jgi:hypothetical protein
MATPRARNITRPINPNPTVTAVDHDDAEREAKTAAVITAMPTDVPIRWPVCMMAPELPA